MTTLRHLYVREYAEDKQDNFLNSLTIDLTTDQEDYLRTNRSMDRPQLFKLFKKKFNSPINKIQFNFALEKVKGVVPKVIKKSASRSVKHPKPAVEAVKNVRWITQQGVWRVSFKRNGKTLSLGRYKDHKTAAQVADNYRQNLA